jgi:hypothetical protein
MFIKAVTVHKFIPHWKDINGKEPPQSTTQMSDNSITDTPTQKPVSPASKLPTRCDEML